MFEPNLFFNSKTQVYILIHVDDMHMCGPDKEMKKVVDRLSVELVMKSKGPFKPGDTYKFLGMTRKVEAEQTLLIPDKSYIEETSHQLELAGCRPAKTPATNLTPQGNDKEELSAEEGSLYRSCVGRLMYLSHSRMDIQWAVRMLACKMRSPTQHDMRSLRHLVRYLEGTKDMAIAFPRRNQAITQVECYCDSDWASHHTVARRSVSGGVLYVNNCLMLSWSRGQTVTAMSSGEAEFYSLILGTQEALGLQSTLIDLGLEPHVRVHTDSSAARAMTHRLGPGSHVKHIETRRFFIQQLVTTRRIEVAKCLGEENMADLLTKAVSARVLGKLLPMCGLVAPPLKEIRALQASQVDKKWLYGLVGVLQMVCCKAGEDDEDGGSSLTSWMWFIMVMLSAFSWWMYLLWRAVRWYTTSAVPTSPTMPPSPVSAPTRTTWTQTGLAASSHETVYLTDSNTAQGSFHLTRSCGRLIHARRVLSRAVCKDCDQLHS